MPDPTGFATRYLRSMAVHESVTFADIRKAAAGYGITVHRTHFHAARSRAGLRGTKKTPLVEQMDRVLEQARAVDDERRELLDVFAQINQVVEDALYV